jgi:hypothetical protein
MVCSCICIPVLSSVQHNFGFDWNIINLARRLHEPNARDSQALGVRHILSFSNALSILPMFPINSQAVRPESTGRTENAKLGIFRLVFIGLFAGGQSFHGIVKVYQRNQHDFFLWFDLPDGVLPDAALPDTALPDTALIINRRELLTGNFG